MVKATKAEAHYRGGTNSRYCSICTMFRAPDSCTAVKGTIKRDGLCNYFKRSVSAMQEAMRRK